MSLSTGCVIASVAGSCHSSRRSLIRARLIIAAAFLAVLMYVPVARSGTRPPGVTPFWWALGTCETGHIGEAGDGAPRFDWGARRRHLEGSTYEGFVGFYWATWQLWGRAVGAYPRYRHAYLAPPLVQVRVGRYGLAHRGFWGCLKAHPWMLSLAGR